jgi:hypothetical protein
LEFFA